MSACAQGGDVVGEVAQVVGICPGDDHRRNARPIHRRDLGAYLVHRHLVSGMCPDHRDAGGVGAGFMVGGPVDRAALQEAIADATAFDDDRRARRGRVRAGAGVRNAECVEPGDRCGNCVVAIVHVVGYPHRGDAGAAERLATDGGRREESFAFRGVTARRLVQAALEIAEHNVRGAKFILHARERHGGIVHVHQIDIAGEDHPGHAAMLARRHCVANSRASGASSQQRCARRRECRAVRSPAFG